MPDEVPSQVIVELQAGIDADRHFETVFRAFRGSVTAYFGRQGVPPEQARDLTQEVFLTVLAKIGTLREPEAFRGWLFSIARFKFLQHLEAKRTEPEPAPQAAEAEGDWTDSLVDATPDPLEQAMNGEQRRRLRDALEDLPQQMRACVKMSVVDGLPYADIAGRLGLSVNTVKVQLHRARHSLITRLGAGVDIDTARRSGANGQ